MISVLRSYRATDVPHVPKVPTHGSLIAIWCEELQVVQFRSTPSRMPFHVEADPGGDAQSHLQSRIVQLQKHPGMSV